MRGKLAKQLRRLAAHPSLPERTYDSIHVKTVVRERENMPDLVIEKHMVILTRCQRAFYQRMKGNIKRIRNGMEPRPVMGV